MKRTRSKRNISKGDMQGTRKPTHAFGILIRFVETEGTSWVTTRMPMGERVTDEPIVCNLKERVHRDRLILLGGCPPTDLTQCCQHGVVGRQKDPRAPGRHPIT
jgi:hypothetical protein